MAEGFGGPVWHASGRGRDARASLRIARIGVAGVGDPELGEWLDERGTGRGVVHLQRRLSADEQAAFGVPDPIDVRGTDEERCRVQQVLAESSAPVRAQVLAAYGGRL